MEPLFILYQEPLSPVIVTLAPLFSSPTREWLVPGPERTFNADALTVPVRCWVVPLLLLPPDVSFI